MFVDAVVIGSGIIGLAVARRLRQAGYSVRVLEKGIAGREASWAGAGMLAPHAESFPDAYWTGLAHQALAEYPAFVQELAVPIDFRISGSLEYRDGQVIEHPDEAQVNPRDVLDGLKTGLQIDENCHVAAIQNIAGGVSVAGIEARAAIIAAGAWSGLIEGAPPCFPIRGHLLAYEMPAGSLGPILRREHTYILQRATGLTIVGSTEERVGFNRELDGEAIADLQRRGAQLWPVLAGSKPTGAWVGFRPATPTGVPEVGRLEETNVWCAYGHFRNGILLADVTARLVAGDIIASWQRD